VDADGVHLGQDDLPIEHARKLVGNDGIIGISTHSVEQAITAASAGADYIGFGPIFTTATKDAGPSRGIDMLRAVRAEIKVPILAIGGISLENAGEVIAAGASGIAVISAILDAPDVGTSARALIERVERSLLRKHER
jgi:thiamine-phosphate pyrophosphorylase